jgi:chromosome segregation ATPase
VATSNKEQLDRIEKAIIGNGNEGLLARTARIEERLENAAKSRTEIKEEQKKLVTNNQEAIENTNSAIRKIETSVNEICMNYNNLQTTLEMHLATEHIAKLIKRKSFWIGIVATLIVVNLIALYLPNIWDIIIRMLGLPGLIIPTP